MTIILSTKRDNFAVLTADRLLGTHLGPLGEAMKLVRHPKLPLAFAVGGMMRFYLAPRYAWAMEHVAEFADTITSLNELVVREIAERLEKRFQDAMNVERNKMQIFIALVKDGKADLGAQWVSASTITDDPTWFYPDRSRYLIPCHLHDFYGKGALLDAMNDQAVNVPQEVGRLAREAIQAGIEQERQEGKHTTIGGVPDVVVVTDATPPFLI
jgi:hypothetical protein